MRSCIWTIGLMGLWGCCALGHPLWADEQAEVAAIQKAIDSYVQAFNKADAKAVAGHWSAQGEFVVPNGKSLQGREQLEKEFAAEFAEQKNAKLELTGTQIELISPSVAVETGTARLLLAGEEPRETQYKAIHVKTAEGWKMDSVREAETRAPAPSHYDQLQALEWMIGSWSDADADGTVETVCRWTRNQNFIARSFKVRIDDEVDFEGTQVIGWDPMNQTIRSWMFDSDGGFAVGRWTGQGGHWKVQALHVLPDGRRASSTNVFDVLDDGKVRFESIGRQVDGELLPNIGPIELVRTDQP